MGHFELGEAGLDVPKQGTQGIPLLLVLGGLDAPGPLLLRLSRWECSGLELLVLIVLRVGLDVDIGSYVIDLDGLQLYIR